MSAERIASPVPVATPEVAPAAPNRGEQRAQLAKLASEFESLLLANVLRDMRSSARWAEEDSSDMLGAGAFGQTFDTELARNLSQSGGFGLSAWLMKAFDRYASAAAEAGSAEPISPSVVAERVLAGPGHADPVETAGSVPSSLDALARPTSALTSGFGWRKDPLTGAMAFHRGVDLKAAEGDPVMSTGAGRVVFSGHNGGYGNSVVIEHANGVKTRYAHLSATLVGVGDQVGEGQPIGRAGHTGRATGTHVHYEVLAGGQPIDPLR